jgi:hypothetical protein
VKVLTSPDELIDEGSSGINVDGTNGLDHCVAGYSDSCSLGRSRIVSLRRRRSGRPDIRLSTAQIEIRSRSYRIVQHQAKGNTPPSRVCDAALHAYLRALQNKSLAVDHAAFIQKSDHPESKLQEGAGYNFWVPGAWGTARDAWSRFLPRYARTWGPKEFTAFVKTKIEKQ